MMSVSVNSVLMMNGMMMRPERQHHSFACLYQELSAAVSCSEVLLRC